MRASISVCGTYRYWLERKWGPGFPQVFAMLNPSTADASLDDPTIRRCIAFAKREGAGGLIVVNLFGLRATDPKQLDGHADPVGPENDHNVGLAFVAAAAFAKPIICAWGANKNAEARGRWLVERAHQFGVSTVCLGTTKDGHPRHPLYVHSDAALSGFVMSAKIGGAA